jgi:hypothetical protein
VLVATETDASWSAAFLDAAIGTSGLIAPHAELFPVLRALRAEFVGVLDFVVGFFEH